MTMKIGSSLIQKTGIRSSFDASDMSRIRSVRTDGAPVPNSKHHRIVFTQDGVLGWPEYWDEMNVQLNYFG
ncbi:hypothetical protein C2S52_016904 [Perilla frutescens var. hirtella]|nr:hypothetical protein C2S52_016904 [Perilla frutescens var. hirtella]KAH6810729.1 hypothetical protein C2S51_024491 [Perilla frutescens var. frutescens]KAH6814327.1 hypothetical protein C2S51_023345 [Perilla frutescens var. frutescens]